MTGKHVSRSVRFIRSMKLFSSLTHLPETLVPALLRADCRTITQLLHIATVPLLTDATYG